MLLIFWPHQYGSQNKKNEDQSSFPELFCATLNDLGQGDEWYELCYIQKH